MACACTPDTLSLECRYTAECLSGVAKSRADRYARQVSEVSGWPTSSEIRAAAAEWVADLGSCDRMRAELADVFGGWAAQQLALRSVRPRS